MLFGFFFFDWTLLIVLPALLFTMWAQFRVQSSYRRYSEMRLSSAYAQTARASG